MKCYDFKKAKDIIESAKENIHYAQMGMREDWMYTYDTVFRDGNYLIDLTVTENIKSLSGSLWATPVLYIEYYTGDSAWMECHDNGESIEPDSFTKYMLKNRHWKK